MTLFTQCNIEDQNFRNHERMAFFTQCNIEDWTILGALMEKVVTDGSKEMQSWSGNCGDFRIWEGCSNLQYQNMGGLRQSSKLPGVQYHYIPLSRYIPTQRKEHYHRDIPTQRKEPRHRDIMTQRKKHCPREIPTQRKEHCLKGRQVQSMAIASKRKKGYKTAFFRPMWATYI